jgi:hypothetical protein
MTDADADDSFVLLTTARDNVDAMGIRSVLEAEGIEVFVQGEHHRAMEGAFGIFVELRVMVRRSDLDEARELLEEAKFAEHLPAEETAAADVADKSVRRFNEDRPDIERTHERRPNPIVAVLLAIVLPIGAGHFYVGKRRTGMILGALLVIDWILFFQGWTVTLAVVALVAFDALGALIAARRAQT